MAQCEPFLSLLLALFAGLLIGMERQQRAESQGSANAKILGGVRTHPLVALVGACAMLLERSMAKVLEGAGVESEGTFDTFAAHEIELIHQMTHP